jgi:hypothetical protein
MAADALSLAAMSEANGLKAEVGRYHGLHFGGMSACGGDAWGRSYEPLVPGFINVESPNLYRRPVEVDETLSEMCATPLEREIPYQSSDTIAALIAEPVQGAGGVHVPLASYWPKLRAICGRYAILLIADEVITGLGRAAALLGVRQRRVKPDRMCLAKGVTSGYMPLGATLLNERVAAARENEGPRAVVMHGYTDSGYPVGCAADVAAVDLILARELDGDCRSGRRSLSRPAANAHGPPRSRWRRSRQGLDDRGLGVQGPQDRRAVQAARYLPDRRVECVSRSWRNAANDRQHIHHFTAADLYQRSCRSGHRCAGPLPRGCLTPGENGDLFPSESSLEQTGDLLWQAARSPTTLQRSLLKRAGR